MFSRSLLGALLFLLLVFAQGVVPAQAAVDPTRPPAVQPGGAEAVAQTASPWQLQAIRISAQARRAVINGISVREGERVRGADVVAIEPGSVVLSKGSRRIQLELQSSVNSKRNAQESQ